MSSWHGRTAGAALVCSLILAIGALAVTPPRARAATPAPAATKPQAATPVPSAGNHTGARGVARPASPDTPANDQAETSIPGEGAPLNIAQQDCQPSADSASALQNQFNLRGPVWGGGDGAEPVPIDGGRTLWLFGDTYLGGGPLNGPLDNKGFVHNSMAVQYNGSCFLYLFRGDSLSGWYSAIPEPSDTDYYWPTSGAYDTNTGVLTIMAMRVHTVNPNDPFGWQLVGADLLHYRIQPSFTLTGTERLFTYGASDRAQFGQNATLDGNAVYLYGCAQTPPTDCFVARTNPSMQASSLAYWSSSGWVGSLADADPIGLDDMVGAQLHVAKVGDGYIASNQLPLMDTITYGWWGPSAIQPFASIGAMWNDTDRPYGPFPSNWFSYGGRVINTSAGPVGVFSVNTFDNEGATVAGIYGPRFVTVAPHVLDRNPFGYLDSASTEPGAARVVGWSIDPDTDDPIQVRITIDGQLGPVVTADASRPDVHQAYPAFGPNHGYDTDVPLTPGLHQVCVTAINALSGLTNRLLGCLLASGSGPASGFTATTPTRLLDSRTGVGGSTTPWAQGETRSVTVAGTGPVPADATAVILNVTVTNPTAPGYVTLSPTGGLVPLASNLNFRPGETIPNLVTVAVGTGGKINITNPAGHTDLVADVVGYYRAGTGTNFDAVTPTRILDSRDGTGGPARPWGAGEIRTVAVAGGSAVPAGATAVVMNVTVTNPTAPSWLRVSPTGTAPPLASNLNFSAGQTISNLVAVGLGTGGKVDITNLSGSTDVIADVVGYYTPGAGAAFVPLSPTRILDSRTGTGGYTSPWGQQQIRSVGVGGTSMVPAAATAAVMNVTVTNPSAPSWLRVSPTGAPPPLASNLNFDPGDTIANLVTVGLGAGGRVDITNLNGHTDVIADVVGYFTT